MPKSSSLLKLLATENEKVSALEAKVEEDKKKLNELRAGRSKVKRQVDARRKFLKGELLDSLIQSGVISEALYAQELDNFLTVSADRELFNLDPLPQ